MPMALSAVRRGNCSLQLRPVRSARLSPLLPAAQPEWLKVISDMEADIGSSLRWGCAAAGKPRPTVRWLRNGEPLASQVGTPGASSWFPHSPAASLHRWQPLEAS